VLRSATLINAEMFGMGGEVGVVAQGAFADILLLEGDPLADIGLLARPTETLDFIMRGGEIVLDRVSQVATGR